MQQYQMCVACRSSELELVGNVPDANAGTEKSYDFKRCLRCGTTRLATLLTPADLERIYPPDFYSYLPQVSANKVFAAANRFVYNRHRFKPEFGHLLEIGSGRGDFIADLHAQDRAVGLERSEAARAAGRAIGVDVVVGDVENEGLFAPSSFDYIYSNHAFEHLNEPDAALRSMHKWLHPDGRMFMGIPNIGSTVAGLFSRFWYHFAAPLHVTLYTPRGIREILARNGFAIERIDYNSDPLSVPMSLWISAGRYPVDIGRLEKLFIRALSVPVLPVSKMLDRFGLGDCMEIHARRI